MGFGIYGVIPSWYAHTLPSTSVLSSVFLDVVASASRG
jgi:hypothetical protein